MTTSCAILVAGTIAVNNAITALAVSPDGAHLYAAGYGEDAVAVFDRDGATGRLTFVEVYRDGSGGVDGLDGARAVVVSPDGLHVYVAGYMEDAVAVFARNSATGALAFQQVVRDNTGGVDGVDGVDGTIKDIRKTVATLDNPVTPGTPLS